MPKFMYSCIFFIHGPQLEVACYLTFISCYFLFVWTVCMYARGKWYPCEDTFINIYKQFSFMQQFICNIYFLLQKDTKTNNGFLICNNCWKLYLYLHKRYNLMEILEVVLLFQPLFFLMNKMSFCIPNTQPHTCTFIIEIMAFEMHFSGNGIMSRTTECLHYMHLWVQLVSGVLLYIVLCALHIFVYPPPWIYGLSFPEHWLLTIVSQHSSSCSALSLLERMEDGSTADFNFLCFLTTIQLFMEPPCTSHSCFILEHLGSTSHRVILSRMWTVLWSCNSGLSYYTNPIPKKLGHCTNCE